jgi:hypothetical protein
MMGILLLAIGEVAAILVLERVVGGLSRDAWFVLGCVPWVIVAGGGFLAEEATTRRGLRLGHLLEAIGLVLHVALLALAAVLAADRDLGADAAFIAWSLQAGLSLGTSWLLFRICRGLGAMPLPPEEAAALWRRGLVGPVGRVQCAVAIVGEGAIFTVLVGALFAASALFLLAVGAGGPGARLRWVATLVFFGLAAGVGVAEARRRWRVLVHGGEASGP